MDVIQGLLEGIPLPKMVRVKQTFPDNPISDIVVALREELNQSEITKRLRPGMSIAIGVGSRGVAQIPLLVKTTVEFLKEQKTYPFVVPAMGSHGGATEEGQREVLQNLGVTEEYIGCPIKATMDVVELGRLDNGLPVYLDKYAAEADGIISLNRVKPHTCFRGPNESGMIKMLTIGLGKQKGAESCHSYGFQYMAEHLVAMAKIMMEKAPVLFGIGTVENAYDRIIRISVVPKEDMLETDRQMQVQAKEHLAKLYFEQIDVLVIDRIGKDISGDGMDPNITGRYPSPYATGGPKVSKMLVLDLTEQTHGNANGMGTADFSTRKLFDKIDFVATYANGLTSTVVGPTHVPTILETDRDAILAGIKTSNARDFSKVRLVRIKDTLHMDEIWVSEAMLDEVRQHHQMKVLSEPTLMRFDEAGNLL
ncbi:MAG: lactate racemase domain-containing protein [Anaeromusa sp.]|uniref:lactate racemase domain-containing protein n=1 Tax=Anaeromusa sp. TaxID=1872520 RepID=UPI002B20AF22|nr:lactate racemase domain-containing protein [Anaeromusa sp.]MEA4835218.1 lactate racemase domain-containing protein [Anaeromusa sp.]